MRPRRPAREARSAALFQLAAELSAAVPPGTLATLYKTGITPHARRTRPERLQHLRLRLGP
ncbi:hypothetical protein [Streptomyces sp. NPDC096105]|uniref:hypothetical protein n=1 Tax=Streptomyces sp. NPDC096105 TaxID=3366074 RepID=UPI00380BD3BC